MSTWLKQLSIGSYLEVQDTLKHWCVACIKEIDDNGNRIKISYDGWDEKWSEWINTTSNLDRIAPLPTHTAPCIFNAPPSPIGDSKIAFDAKKCCISQCKSYILFVILHPTQQDTIIIDKYYKSSNQYKRN